MDKYEIVLNDIKDILETIGEVNHVSHGKVKALDAEDTFTSIYISPEMDNFENHIQNNTMNGYMNTFFVRLTVHIDCTGDDLLWVTTRSLVTNAILNDKAIWTNIIDRDLVSIAHDDYTNYPRKALAMLFEFRLREDCVL